MAIDTEELKEIFSTLDAKRSVWVDEFNTSLKHLNSNIDSLFDIMMSHQDRLHTVEAYISVIKQFDTPVTIVELNKMISMQDILKSEIRNLQGKSSYLLHEIDLLKNKLSGGN